MWRYENTVNSMWMHRIWSIRAWNDHLSCSVCVHCWRTLETFQRVSPWHTCVSHNLPSISTHLCLIRACSVIWNVQPIILPKSLWESVCLRECEWYRGRTLNGNIQRERQVSQHTDKDTSAALTVGNQTHVWPSGDVCVWCVWCVWCLVLHALLTNYI